MLVQGLVAVVFLYFFYRVNKTIVVLENELHQQTAISKKLNHIADSIEQQMVFNNLKDSLAVNIESHSASEIRQHLPVQRDSPVIKKLSQPKEVSKPLSDAPSIMAIEEIAMYEYQFNQELRISRWETINEIKGILLIKYDPQKQPKDYKAEIEMKQTNEESSEMVQKLTFRCIGCEVKPDNTFRCIFQENPLPAANEFDAQNPRKLSISLTGSFDNLEMNGLLVWNEVTGRQANARIKLTLKKIGRP